MQRRVFHGLLDAEVETAGGRQKEESSITPANYTVRLLGEEVFQGRHSYILELQPKRSDKYLFKGKIWVDREDFAIAKLEGEPARNLSFWVTRAFVIREYQKVGEFWIPRNDQTLCHVRLAGDYVLRIDYTDYTVNGQTVLCRGCPR